MSEDIVISAKGLRKVYGSQVAVASLDLVVRRGEVFGLLGPNGAGKSTAVKMLLDLVHPSAGHATILGYPTTDPRARRHVGFLPEHLSFHRWLRADEFLDVHARLLGVSPALRRKQIPELLARVGLANVAHKPLGAFSKGMLQRIGLAQALIGEPEIIFLDEPTSGLDPIGRRMVRDLICDLRQRGITVFLNSHLLSEVEVTCTRVAFIAQGRVLETRDLNSDWGTLQVVLRVGEIRDDWIQSLERWGRVKHVDAQRCAVAIELEREELIPQLVRWLVAQGIDLYCLEPQRLSLENLFLQIVEHVDDASYLAADRVHPS